MPVTWDQMMKEFTPAERAEIKRGAAVIVAENRTLAQLRKGVSMTQQALAKALKTSQANISEIENKGDALVSTVARVVAGVGGRLLLYAEMPDGSRVPLRMAATTGSGVPSAARPKRRGLTKARRRAGPSEGRGSAA